ncbi:hypothetical protein SDC9_137778 [bioreactor metagenome]|uniref:Uncharacterized protein n=1 Tax=bioreactor metagenome TaxID=1076179 RepID=A0A645DMW8_9ZZZZ
MQRNVIRFGKNPVDIGDFNPEFFGQSGTEHGVVAEHFHFKSGQALDQQLPDIAEAENPDGFAGQFAAHELLLFPFPGPGGNIRRNQVAAGGQHHGDDFLGHAVGIGAGSVHHVDVFLARVFGIDGIESRSGTHDQLQFRQQIDLGRTDFFAAHDHDRGIAVGLQEIVNRRIGILNDLKAFVFQQLRRKFIQLGRD